jgi:hypothetical protein
MLKQVKDKSITKFQEMLNTQFAAMKKVNPEATEVMIENMVDAWSNGWDCCATSMHTLIEQMLKTSLGQK